jgi:hypothetical protein
MTSKLFAPSGDHGVIDHLDWVSVEFTANYSNESMTDEISLHQNINT